MARLYGIPYMGSKSNIAPYIVHFLPGGKRFVDLFGGGFAMSHAACLSGKWDDTLYNELNPLLPALIKDAIDGKYSIKNYKPEFITREQFFDRRDHDGFVRYLWSFGNKGHDYLYGKEVEPLKHEAHDFIVFGKPTQHFGRVERYVTANDYRERRLQFLRQCKRIRQLRRGMSNVEHLERLQHLERLEHLEIRCGSYLDYEYRDGDVVYCDPPYEGTEAYDKENGFDFATFYEWVKTRPYQVWFSSYQGLADRFRLVWAQELRCSMGTGNNTYNFECLYTNR